LTDARVLQDRVQEAAAYMRARPHGGLFVVCLDNLSASAKENLAAILARARFVQAIPMTGMAIINEGCLFLFLVATAPDARRKGYGEAVVRHALQKAHEATGIRRTVLHATEPGYPIYLRLGYHPTVKLMGCMLGS
jgi:GNAT superfamily N-acetyltransferase